MVASQKEKKIFSLLNSIETARFCPLLSVGSQNKYLDYSGTQAGLVEYWQYVLFQNPSFTNHGKTGQFSSTRNVFSVVVRVLIELESVGYHQGLCATLACLGPSCSSDHCCRSYMLQLGRTVGWLPLLESCMLSSDTMRASPQRGHYKISSISSPLGFVCGFFNTRDLTFASGRQPWATAVPCNVWKSLGQL